LARVAGFDRGTQAHCEFHCSALIEIADPDEGGSSQCGEHVLNVYALGHQDLGQRWGGHKDLLFALLEFPNKAPHALASIFNRIPLFSLLKLGVGEEQEREDSAVKGDRRAVTPLEAGAAYQPG
jgi:hypothetical protein